MGYEWDPDKAKLNFRKHGIAFADAVSVFFDDSAITVEDNNPDEVRFATLGMDAFGHVLVWRVHMAWGQHPTDLGENGYRERTEAIWRVSDEEGI